jgi:hypothetical protein
MIKKQVNPRFQEKGKTTIIENIEHLTDFIIKFFDIPSLIHPVAIVVERVLHV